ncbi:hypothetical protein HYV73_03585 [Candidatus Uhrbacteria bacterium]|nr:hypothetical protein [Candidatus Uhrbacteria bacterium]
MNFIEKNLIRASVAATLLLPAAAHAQLSNAAQNLQNVTPPSIEKEATNLIPNLIDGALSVLGIIFLFYVLYAGFLYMTAEEDTKKTGKAKDMLRNGIIGLIIIIASYAIANFVISTLNNVAA